jgi:hypothetical protein
MSISVGKPEFAKNRPVLSNEQFHKWFGIEVDHEIEVDFGEFRPKSDEMQYFTNTFARQGLPVSRIDLNTGQVLALVVDQSDTPHTQVFEMEIDFANNIILICFDDFHSLVDQSQVREIEDIKWRNPDLVELNKV